MTEVSSALVAARSRAQNLQGEIDGLKQRWNLQRKHYEEALEGAKKQAKGWLKAAKEQGLEDLVIASAGFILDYGIDWFMTSSVKAKPDSWLAKVYPYMPVIVAAVGAFLMYWGHKKNHPRIRALGAGLVAAEIYKGLNRGTITQKAPTVTGLTDGNRETFYVVNGADDLTALSGVEELGDLAETGALPASVVSELIKAYRMSQQDGDKAAGLELGRNRPNMTARAQLKADRAYQKLLQKFGVKPSPVLQLEQKNQDLRTQLESSSQSQPTESSYPSFDEGDSLMGSIFSRAA